MSSGTAATGLPAEPGRPRPDGEGAARPLRAALVVAGAAGVGPFAAGALSALAAHQRQYQVTAVVGASSGALNGALYAAGLRAGRAGEAAALAEDLWRDRARMPQILSDDYRRSIVREALERFGDLPRVAEVRLRLLVTSMRGELREAEGHRYTSFEDEFVFTARDLESGEGMRFIAEAAVASAALPVIFKPQMVQERGPYWDGGLVNNTPIGKAIDDDPGIEHIVIITPDPALVPPREHFGRFSLGRLKQIAIDERLARDILTARRFNKDLRQLAALGVDMDRVRAGMSWRLLDFLEIRPEDSLPAGFLGGFFSRKRREDYLAAGRAAAQRVLDAALDQHVAST